MRRLVKNPHAPPDGPNENVDISSTSICSVEVEKSNASFEKDLDFNFDHLETDEPKSEKVNANVNLTDSVSNFEGGGHASPKNKAKHDPEVQEAQDNDSIIANVDANESRYLDDQFDPYAVTNKIKESTFGEIISHALHKTKSMLSTASFWSVIVFLITSKVLPPEYAIVAYFVSSYIFIGGNSVTKHDFLASTMIMFISNFQKEHEAYLLINVCCVGFVALVIIELYIMASRCRSRPMPKQGRIKRPRSFPLGVNNYPQLQAQVNQFTATPVADITLVQTSKGYKKRLTRNTDPLQPHEIKVMATSPRPHIQVELVTGKKEMCLVDTGASSNCVSEDVINELIDEGVNVPFLKTTFSVRHVGSNNPIKDLPVCLLTIRISETHVIKDCPFIVMKEGARMLIGNNTLMSKRYSLISDDGSVYLGFVSQGKVSKQAQVYLKTNKEYELRTLAEVSILPGQVKTIETFMPDVPEHIKSNLEHKSIHVSPNAFSNDCVVESVSLVRKSNKVQVRLLNSSKEERFFPENSIIAEARIVKNSFLQDLDAVDIHEVYQVEKKFSSISQSKGSCSCKYHNCKDFSTIVFCDKYGTSHFNNYDTLQSIPFNEIPSKAEKVRRGTNFVSILPDHEDSLAQAARTLSNRDEVDRIIPTSEVIVLAGASESFSLEQTEIITKLSELRQVRIVRIRNNGECPNCLTIANGDLVQFLRGTDSIKVIISSGKNQVHPHEARVDEKSPMGRFTYFGDSKVAIYTAQTKILVFIHVVDPHRSDHYVKNLLYCIFEHLRRQKLAKSLSVFTDEFQNKAGYLCKQTSMVLRHLLPFEVRSQVPEWVLGPKSSTLKQVPYFLEDCFCEACDSIRQNEIVYCKPLQLVLDGQIENLEQNIRVPKEVSCAEAVINFLKMDDFGSSKDWEECGIKPEHYEKATTYPHQLDPEDTQQFVSRDWRLSIDESKIPLPMKKAGIIEALDEFAPQYFSHCAEYRFMNIPPVKVETIEGFKPFIEKSRFMPPSESQFLDHKLSEMLSIGNVRIVSERELKNNVYCISRVFCTHQNSTTARQELLASHGKAAEEGPQGNAEANPCPQKKCDRSTSKKRLILDLRSINALTKVAGNEALIIKSPDEIIHRTSGAKYAISLDLTKSFRSLKLDKTSSLLYCFQHPYSQKFANTTFTLTSCPDGARLSPTILTKALTDALAGTEAYALFYMDDILIFAKTYEELVQNFIDISKRLIKLGALVNASKCEIGVTEFVFLGHKFELNNGNVRYGVSDERKATFDILTVPKSKYELQRLLGVICFVRSMVPGIFIIVLPLLYALRNRGNKTFQLDEEQEKAFWLAVKALKNSQYNYVYSWEKEGSIICDASKWGFAAALIQLDDQNRPQIIKYSSKAFPAIVTSSKSALYKEALSVYLSALEFEVFVANSPRFCIYTDCSVLVYICANLVECRDEALSRLIHRIYNIGVPFRLKHVAAHSIGLADMYSRLYGFDTPTTVTGLPLHSEEEIREYMKDFPIPKGWLDPQNYLTLDDMVKEFQKDISGNAKLSDNVKQKRMDELGKRIKEQEDHPVEYLSSPSLRSTSRRTVHPLSTDVAMVEYHSKSAAVEAAGVSPPCNFSTITPKFIYELQQDDPLCRWILRAFTTKSITDLPKRVVKRFRVVDQSIILTKKKKSGKWDLANMRIYIPEKSVLKLMCVMHVSMAHLAKNALIAVYNRNFKSRKSAVYARLLILSCRTCQLYRRGHKSLPKSRIGHAKAPGDMYFIDILDIGPGKFDNKNVRYLLCAVDSYSSMILCQPMSDMKLGNIQMALEKMFSAMPINGSTIVSDNQNTLCGHPAIRQLLKNMNFKEVLTSSSYRSTSNGMIESALYKVRTGLAMNKETWRTKSLWDLLSYTMLMINNRPLFKFCNADHIVTPISLFYGTKPSLEVTEKLIAPLDEPSRARYRRKYDLLVRSWEKAENDRIAKARENFKSPYKLEVGTIVLYENKVRKKSSEPLYFKDLFEIITVGKSRLEIKSIFYKSKPIWVSADYVKPFVTSPLISQLLPEEFQIYLGRSFDPNKLKAGEVTPSLIEREANFEPPRLRNRLSPQERGAKVPVMVPKETDSMSWPSSSSSSSLRPFLRREKEDVIPTVPPQQGGEVAIKWDDPSNLPNRESGEGGEAGSDRRSHSSSDQDEYFTPARSGNSPTKRVQFAVPENRNIHPLLPGRYPDSPELPAGRNPREVQESPLNLFNPGSSRNQLGPPPFQSSPAHQQMGPYRNVPASPNASPKASPNTSGEYEDAHDTFSSPTAKDPGGGITDMIKRLMGASPVVPMDVDSPGATAPPPAGGSGRNKAPIRESKTSQSPYVQGPWYKYRTRSPSPSPRENTQPPFTPDASNTGFDLGASPELAPGTYFDWDRARDSPDGHAPPERAEPPRRSKRTTKGVPPKRFADE